MRKFAFFLPQFHEIQENNLWWGKGFTEWQKVKSAKKLYYSHPQPQVPLNKNYYNLLDKNTVQWQTELMNKYGIDGFIYYHYYFQGKMLLEKPAENLLSWKDIDQPFFFCWANHSWYRSWEGSKELLLEQKYGDIMDWQAHFDYLLPFFKDTRYEKKDNKPLFMIFNPRFKEEPEIFQFFDQKCRENGFNGICLIESYMGPNWASRANNNVNKIVKVPDYIFLREPGFGTWLYKEKIKYTPMRVIRKIKRELAKRNISMCVDKYNGNRLYKWMTKYQPEDKNIIRGAFFEWDNTPRHSIRGYIITPPCKQKFFNYMNSRKQDDYIFFNAWNEWAEGMMLEPTERNGYKYLEWIQEWTELNRKQ